MDLETRCCVGSRVELRKEGDSTVIEGYAAVFYDGTPETEFRLLRNVYERVTPGAFDAQLARRDNIVGLFNHDEHQVLASVQGGTLEIWKDRRGLKYRMKLDERTPVSQNVAGFVRRGDVSGSSFGFLPPGRTGQKWSRDSDGREIRELVEIEIRDVGPATFPAYVASTVIVERSLCEWRKHGGKSLSGLLNELVDAKTSEETPRSDVVSAMAKAGGISPGTVNQILAGEIDCPPIQRLGGFALALGVSADRLRKAAESDGCSYGRKRAKRIERQRRMSELG